jgi:tRNA pseudouridine55 synthase
MATPPKANAGDLHGILLIDKQRGWTSHDVVARTRGITQQRKIGHTGTLDPMATGLLVLCLGDATRLIEYMTMHDKRYEGEITLGAATDTDDADGTVISTADVPTLTGDDLGKIASGFVGEQMQRPPAYSAVKVAGRRAYAVARSGGKPDVAERPVVVHHLELVQIQPTRLSIRLHCGSGTYVRSIARDIGERLGCGAHLSALRRTHVGDFALTRAVSLDDLERLANLGQLEDVLLPPDDGIAAFDAAILTSGNAANFKHGIAIATDNDRESASPVRIYDAAGSFHGVGRLQGLTGLKPLKVLANSR